MPENTTATTTNVQQQDSRTFKQRKSFGKLINKK